MSYFICPICKQKLDSDGRSYRCCHNHSFDISKFGYVNLLQSQQSSKKRHGDDRIMIRARRDFLSEGYYSFLREELIRICDKYLKPGSRILDAGCGECYYSQGIKEKIPSLDFLGIDISKDALEFAGKRKVNFSIAAASVFNMPVESEYFDCVINCFSLLAEEEYFRVLKKGGVLICVVPLENHLFSLKEAIYNEPYLNPKPESTLTTFKMEEYREIRKKLYIDTNRDVRNLFRMTPYYYKTGREDQEKLDNISQFETNAEFGIMIFIK